MDNQSIDSSIQDKIRQQFDSGPYPRIPLEGFPKDDYEQFFQHNLVTAYYLRHRQVADTTNKLILDAGCGSGYKALLLAVANPGARIIGIDLSEQSVKLAQQRLQFHGFDNAEFHSMNLADLPQLGLKFDYINCDEVLYLLPDPVVGLQAMKSVLKPDGLIRANLHNAYERANFYRAQRLFQCMGLMDAAPGEFEQEVVVATMNALKNFVNLKRETWLPNHPDQLKPEKLQEILTTNFLLMGDQGYTIPDLFNFLDQADLEFVSMVNWRRWEITELFSDPDHLPDLWSVGLANASIQEKLHLFELLHPVNRLMDFWCTHPGEASPAADDWSDADWRHVVVHLHPQLRNDFLKDSLIQCIQTEKPFEISQTVKLPALSPVLLESHLAACLLPLWEAPQSIQVLVDRYRQTHPVDPGTLEQVTDETAFATVKDLLNRLDAFLYVLLELHPLPSESPTPASLLRE